MPHKTVTYNLAGMRLSHRLLVKVATEYPGGITADDLTDVFYSNAYITIYRTLQKLVLQGFLKRIKTDEKAGNNHPTVLYFATREGKKKVNHLMGRRFGGDWRPLPLYSNGVY